MHCAFGFVLQLSFDEFITFRKTKVNAYLVSSLKYLLYHISPSNSPWSYAQMSCFARVVYGTRFSTFILISSEYHWPNFEIWIQFDNSQRNLIILFHFYPTAMPKPKPSAHVVITCWSHGISTNWCLELSPNQCLLFLIVNLMAKFKPKIKGITKIKVKQGPSQAQA
jgi:hypothetical protein